MLRVLCLHGWRTNKNVLGFQLGGLQSVLKSMGGIELVCINAPHLQSGPAYAEIQQFFGAGPFFEWWNAEDDSECKYNGVEESVAYVCSYIKENGPFQAVLGFSQGAAMVSALHAFIHRDASLLPIHLRWKCSILVCGIPVRDHQLKPIAEEALSKVSGSVHLIGENDKIKATSKVLASLYGGNTKILFFPEGHQPPSLRFSKDEIALAAQSIWSSSFKTWWAFDFDGVICDSADELCVSGLKAGQQMFPHIFSTYIVNDAELYTTQGGDEPLHISSFRSLRPLLEHGYESIILSYLLISLGDVESVMQQVTENGYESTIQQLGVSKKDLEDGLYQAREQWIQQDESKWLKSHKFYDSIVAHIRLLCDNKQPVYVITTKHKDFAVKLLELAQLDIPQDCVYGQGMGHKEMIINQLSQVHRGKSCFFLEDRLDTLVRASTALSCPAYLAFAGWGYNTSKEIASARHQKFMVMDSQSDFVDYAQKLF